MNALPVLFLSVAACLVMCFHGRRWWDPVHGSKTGQRGTARRRTAPTGDELPRLVRQLASLLAAGRAGPILWQSMVHVLAMEQNRAVPPGPAASNRHGPAPSARPQLVPVGRTDEYGAGRGSVDATLLLVIAVQRASELGLPTAAAIRTTCLEAPAASRLKGAAPRPGALSPEQRRLWLDIAACFDVCEASGAPVAAVLGRLAGTLEAEQDAAAQRETALAGPRATVRLLTWLPMVGLGLGMLMGVDPLGVLFGSPVGWTVLAAGAAFAVAGRAWSARMIAGAAGPSVLESGK